MFSIQISILGINVANALPCLRTKGYASKSFLFKNYGK